MAEKSAYEWLKERFSLISNLEGVDSILSKDAETFMPEGSEEDRSAQLQALALVIHEIISDPRLAQRLTEANAIRESLPSADQRNLFLMRREWVQKNSQSRELATEVARIGIEGNALHTKFKPLGDWNTMKDWYAHTFETARSVAQAKRNSMPEFASDYEALLDDFSPGMKDATIEREFSILKAALPELIKAAGARQALAPVPLPIQGPFPKDQQEKLFKRILDAVGFDFTRGRFDLCESHPSCGGTSDDSRITARFDENNWLNSLFAAVHEAGHGIYVQNNPKEWRYQLAGNHLGMGIHESQSRIIEVQACHTPEFFQFLEKVAREVFDRPDDPALAAQNLEHLVNRMQPSFIRIDADELTYPAHVILRYELEKKLIEGTLKIDDLPTEWNSGIKQLLDIVPSNPSQGHMQDVHWPCGYIGYFPAYTIGDMGAAQFFVAACADRPELRSSLAQGDFTPLREWLCENVHSKGSLLTPKELFVQATGEDLNVKYYLNHLSERFVGKPWQPSVASMQPTTPAPG